MSRISVPFYRDICPNSNNEYMVNTIRAINGWLEKTYFRHTVFKDNSITNYDRAVSTPDYPKAF